MNRLLINLMIKHNSKIPKKSPNSSIFLSDEDDDIDQFRQLEEAVQQDSSDDSDLFLNPDRLKKKFPNLFNETNNTNHKISSSSSFDDNEINFKEKKKIIPDNTEQILQLTNDLHQAFKLVTQKKAELEKEQQKFLKEKKLFAKEKAKYESEQIFADTEASGSTSYMLLNQKYKALKDKYKFKKSEWQREKQQYINQISMLNEKINELNFKKDFSPNRTNSIAHFETSSDSELPNELETVKSSNNQLNNQRNENDEAFIEAKDNPFNLINISPSMESKYSQNKMNLSTLNQNSEAKAGNKKDFKKLFSDGSDNGSEVEQFDIIEDKNINYRNNEVSMSAKSNDNHIENDAIQIQYSQPNSNSRQISPQIPTSLKPFSNESNISIEPKNTTQIEQQGIKMPDVRNWDDYDDSSDAFYKNDNEDSPQIDKPLVFRAVIPKESQKSSNSSGVNSSPPSAKRGKDSADSVSSKIAIKKKNENNKVQKKFSPTKKNIKIAYSQKKAAINNNIDENISNSNDSSPQKPSYSRPPLFNMNIKSNESNITSQKAQLPTTNKPNASFGQNIKRNTQSSTFSLFENYDVNFDADFGEVIDEKDGPNHKKIIKYFDGSTEIIFPNGTRKITRSNCVYVFYQNGDISQDFNDGARAYKYSNGTIDLTLPNGVILCVFPNGQREKHFLNGDKEIIYPSGEIKYMKAANSNNE